ncbi:MAG: alpha-amylase family glycosyl hydrolase, partial [Pyrinomonadaceae bacterium]
MRSTKTIRLTFLGVLVLTSAVGGVAQSAPEVVKVEPPSWWAGSSVNPVRLMIRGRNLSGAQVQVVGRGLRVLGTPKVNERGTYVFVNVAIAANALPGERTLKISTPAGTANGSFDILPPLNRNHRFLGFSQADVMYLIMIDRFCDGDLSNNDPPQSRGLYDRYDKFYYHGGDLQGVIDRLPYLKNLGVTAVWLTPWYDNYDHPNQIELKEEKPSTGFHGYNPQDFYEVEEHFGTLAKLRELVETVHRSGIKIIQDEVVNHTGPYHSWVDDPPTPTWFNGTKEHHLKNVFQTWALHDPRPVEELKRETMEGWFLDFLPDLNQNDPEVSRYLIQNTLWWIGTTGLDGIRMDT